MNEPTPLPVELHRPWIERQPLISRNGDTYGYELRQHSSGASGVTDPLAGSAAVLAHLLGDLDDEWLPAGKRVFLQADLSLLADADYLELLPEGRVVLDLCGALSSDPVVNEAMLLACDGLRRRHIGLCIDDWNLVEASPELLVRAEFVKLDLSALDAFVFYQRFSRLKGLPIRCIARGVADNRHYRFCRDAGFELFQGYFFTRPEIVPTREPGAGLAQLVQIFDLVGAQASPRAIEEAFKRDPTLMLKLLGYINSAGMGVVHKVTSIAHAVQILGYRQLYRWVALLLYTAGKGDTPAALMKTVLTRSRLIELLGKEIVPKHEQDNLFVIGMVSLLDVVFGRPLLEVLARLPLPELVVRAVLDHEGTPGLLLMLAEALEAGEPDRVASLAATLTLSPETVNQAQWEALRWAEKLGATE
jgi:EAL and modified HD-GYP domain-containing signal transduction protein